MQLIVLGDPFGTVPGIELVLEFSENQGTFQHTFVYYSGERKGRLKPVIYLSAALIFIRYFKVGKKITVRVPRYFTTVRVLRTHLAYAA